jgi:hypothetical protein
MLLLKKTGPLMENVHFCVSNHHISCWNVKLLGFDDKNRGNEVIMLIKITGLVHSRIKLTINLLILLENLRFWDQESKFSINESHFHCKQLILSRILIVFVPFGLLSKTKSKYFVTASKTVDFEPNYLENSCFAIIVEAFFFKLAKSNKTTREEKLLLGKGEN